MAAGNDYQDEADRQVVAIIGDGSLSGGIAYEAMNNAGHAGKNLLVILNDNNISIDPSVGAMKDYRSILPPPSPITRSRKMFGTCLVS